MTVKVRFAPSPTGYLHLGNARTALINWLFAQKNKGVFILRIDDTDLERSKPEYEDAIREDLAWLGFNHAQEFRQSDRFKIYQQEANRLKISGRLYPCYETPEELVFKRKTQLSRGVPPLYDRAALDLTESQKKEYEVQGRLPHWRFLLQEDNVSWNDLVRGPVEFRGTHLSDPILIREDGSPVYTFTSVVDDIEFGITHVLRGEDHVTNTAVQIQLMHALGKNSQEFCFGHTNLITNITGETLSKRLGSLSIKSLREAGIEAMTVNSYLAKLGTSDVVSPYLTLEALANDFDLSHFSRSSPKFSETDLWSLNGKLVQKFPFHEVFKRCPDLNENFWSLIRENIKTFDDIALWKTICEKEIQPIITDPEFLGLAYSLLPPLPWTEQSVSFWMASLKEKSGKKGKELFMPLRLALTAQEHGPSLEALLLLIGHAKVCRRFKGEKA